MYSIYLTLCICYSGLTIYTHARAHTHTHTHNTQYTFISAYVCVYYYNIITIIFYFKCCTRFTSYRLNLINNLILIDLTI